MRVLFVPDKFKGTLPAAEVAQSLARGWQRSRPEDEVDLIPMSDGGDGFGSVIGAAVGARTLRVGTVDAAGNRRSARWWWSRERRIAVIETAESNGLALLPKGRFHPFELDTRGVGRLIESAMKAGAKVGLVGVGGSATNDGGFGLARALGWRFLDRTGSDLERWTELHRLTRLIRPVVEKEGGQGGGRCRWTVATDVSNPLLGAKGASRIYGPQKGLRAEDMALAERCLRRLAKVVEAELGLDQRLPGGGAAGGLGFGLQAFLGAKRRLGFEVFAEMTKLDQRLRRADLVVTGEGSVDVSTRMGKGVGQLLERCRKMNRPVLIVGGRVELGGKLPRGVVGAESLVEQVGEARAMEETSRSLERVAQGLGQGWGRASREATPTLDA